MQVLTIVIGILSCAPAGLARQRPSYDNQTFAKRLSAAVRAGDTVELESLVRDRRRANTLVGSTPILVIAASARQVKSCEFLLQRGADPMRRGRDGISALEAAVAMDSLQECKLFRKWPKLMNAVDAGGVAPLYLAKSLPVVRFLLSHGANPTARDHEGIRPLHVFADQGLSAIVDYLVKHTRQDVNTKDRSGNTPLIYVCLHAKNSNSPKTGSDLQVARILVSAGANPHFQNRSGVSACSLALRSHWTEMTSVLHCADGRTGSPAPPPIRRRR